MKPESSKTALVTGASSGIGLELARLFARDEYNLILTARNHTRLEDLVEVFKLEYKVKVTLIAKDLAKPSGAQELYDEIQSQQLPVDILVNNAGFGTLTSFAEDDLNNTLEMIQLNITSLTQLARLFLPAMIQRKSGKIMNVASTAAYLPGPYMAVYYASKAYVLSLSEALSEELEGTGVTVTALCPGPTISGFQARAGMEKTRFTQTMSFMDSKTVAAIGYKGLMENKRVVIPGTANRVGAMASRVMPRKVLMKIIKRLKSEK
jgi:short-subunit dehydrogenase